MTDKLAGDSRHAEQSERGFAESLLGGRYAINVYARHGDAARGCVMLQDTSGYTVHSAYILGGGTSGTAVGVLIDRERQNVTVVLDGRDGRDWTQSQIAEAVDYWERENSPKIYCLHEKSCGAVVYTGEGANLRYLVIRMNLGHCGLPKGHVEKYESERDAALREVREETGVAVTLHDDFREVVSYQLTMRTKKESVYFLGHFDGDGVKIQPSEVSSYRLCSYEEARRMITYENDRAVLDAAHKKLMQLQSQSEA